MSAPNPSTPEATRPKRPISNPFHPANGRVPTFDEIKDLPVGGVMYYRGSVIERVADHACRVDGTIKNYPQDVIDYAIYHSGLGSMSNCYKKYISALEALLGEGSAFDDMLSALKAAKELLLEIERLGVDGGLVSDNPDTLLLITVAIAKAGGQ